jgi:hypothetical protein
MTQIILDANILDKLTKIERSVELCDTSGRVIGRFVPLADMREWEPVTPAASEEELNRREQANEKRYTTAEVLAYLEQL